MQPSTVGPAVHRLKLAVCRLSTVLGTRDAQELILQMPPDGKADRQPPFFKLTLGNKKAMRPNVLGTEHLDGESEIKSI